MRIVGKWFAKKKDLNSFRVKKKKLGDIKHDESVDIDFEPKISSNLQILNNNTYESDKQERVLNTIEQLPADYHRVNCICLFVMLVFYYLSIVTTRFKNILLENINNTKN